jgi:hypothetical protein
MIEKTREVTQEKNDPDVLEEDEAKAHNKDSVSENKRGVTWIVTRLRFMPNAVKPIRETPRPFDLKRVSRWSGRIIRNVLRKPLPAKTA